MKYFVGIDVSLQLSSICIINGDGEIIREAKVPSEPEAIATFLDDLGIEFERIGLEAGPLSTWLRAGLSKAGYEATLLETRHVAAALKAMTVKTDRNDARGIAQLMCLGWFKPAHAKTMVAQEARALLTTRKQLQSKLCDIKTSIRGILRTFGLKVGPVRGKAYDERIRELLTGHAMLKSLITPLMSAQNALGAEYGKLHKQTLDMARRHEVCRCLMSVPGVGAIVGLTYVSAIDDPTRFRRSRDIGSQFGLVPKKDQSGEVDRSGRITKIGDASVRSILYEATHIMLTQVKRFSSLKAWAMRLATRSNARVAKVALARNLAVILHRIWLDGTTFERTQDKTTASAA